MSIRFAGIHHVTAIDEEPNHFGESLKLPPWLEKDRKHIEDVLPLVHPPQEKG